jgi:hypothetical protein
MHLVELERRYYELRGRLAAGQLDERQFEAAQRDLVGADGSGRLWTIDPSGHWLRHDGEHWVPDGPPAPVAASDRPGFRARKLPALPMVAAALATLAVGFLVFDVAPLLRPAPPLQATIAPGVQPIVTPAAALPEAGLTLMGGEPLTEADLEAAAQLVDRFLASVEASSDWPARQALLMEALVPEAAAAPSYYQQFLDLPRQKRLEPRSHRLLAMSLVSGSIASIIAEARYQSGAADATTLGWAFAVVRRAGRLELLSVQLNVAV